LPICRLMEDAAQNVLRTSMELGGNAPLIVFEDADLDKAVQGAMDAKLRNMGEACTAANRILVHEDVADAFQEKFAEAMRARKVGRGTEAGVNIGPIIDEKAREDVHGLVTEAVEAGAEVVTGGKKVEGDGYFYEPTILSVLEDSPILTQEIFGPVAPVVKLDRKSTRLNSSHVSISYAVFC